jgi:hypothetical protein
MKYKSFSPDTEIVGRSLLILFNKEYPFVSPTVQEILCRHGLENIQEDHWYKEQNCLNAFEEIETYHSSAALELIGYLTLSDIHDMQVTDLEADLLYFDTGYQLTHRNGALGYYELISFNEDERTAVMDAFTEYPVALTKGFFTAIVRKHISKDKDCNIAVSEYLSEGETVHRFHISWQ